MYWGSSCTNNLSCLSVLNRATGCGFDVQLENLTCNCNGQVLVNGGEVRKCNLLPIHSHGFNIRTRQCERVRCSCFTLEKHLVRDSCCGLERVRQVSDTVLNVVHRESGNTVTIDCHLRNRRCTGNFNGVLRTVFQFIGGTAHNRFTIQGSSLQGISGKRNLGSRERGNRYRQMHIRSDFNWNIILQFNFV